MNLFNLKNWLLKTIDRINAISDPYAPFTRSLELPPGETMLSVEHRLEELRLHYEAQLERDGMLQYGNRLFIQEKWNDMGDLCIWQGVYAAYRVLVCRARPTDGMAQFNRIRALEGLMAYTQPHLVRGVAYHAHSADTYKTDQKWKKYYFNQGDYYIREDASLDSFAGWLFGMACAVKYGDPKDSAIRKTIIDYGNQLDKDGYSLRNRDGLETEHGNLRVGIFQGPIRNLATATLYRLVEAAGRPNESWRKIARNLGDDFKQTETHFLHKRGWHNDHMAMLIGLAYVMLCEEHDPGRQEAVEGLERLLGKHRRMGNAFLTHGARMVGIKVPDRDIEIADQVLLEFSLSMKHPNGKIPIEQINSTRPNIQTARQDGKTISRTPLPPWTRPAQDYYWQRKPFDLDGFQGRGAPEKVYSGLDFLSAFACRAVADSSGANK